MTGWLSCTFLNSLGILEITSFSETCGHIDKIPEVAGTPSLKKYRAKRELTADDFINLCRIIKKSTKAIH